MTVIVYADSGEPHQPTTQRRDRPMNDSDTGTIMRTYYGNNGAPVARLTASADYNGRGESAGTYCHTTAHTVIVSAGYGVNENYYTETQEATPDGPIARAWNRYSKDEYGNELDGHEASELTQRYARTFYPMVPIVEKRILTGYSQGDEVTVLSWIEPGNLLPTPGEPIYSTAERGRGEIVGHHEIMGAVSRGQFWDVSLETAELTFTQEDDDEDIYIVTVEWGNTDSIGTLAMEEFSPWEELIECGEDHFTIPPHTTHTTHTDHP